MIPKKLTKNWMVCGRDNQINEHCSIAIVIGNVIMTPYILYVQNRIKVHIITKPRPMFNTPLQHQSKPLYAAGCPVWVCLDGGGRNLICEK